MRGTAFLLLGILLTSPVAAEFCDGNFVVPAGDWSDIEIHGGGTVTRETYNWRDSKSANWNRGRMNDPTRFDMPKDTVLHTSSSGYISWIAVYDVQYTYTVQYNGHTYTNNTSSMSYRAAWLERPCRHESDMNRYVDKVTTEPVSDGVKFCVWQHWTDNDRDKHPSYNEKTIPAGIEDVRAWETQDTTINATLTNTSMGYYILDVPIPRGVLGYRIDARSDSHDSFYEHNACMMQRNVTSSGKEFFEVVEAHNTDNQGMSACGANKFILSEDTNYKINVTVYTPFEQTKMNVSMINEEREVETVDKRSALQSLIALITMPLGVYVLIRGMH